MSESGFLTPTGAASQRGAPKHLPKAADRVPDYSLHADKEVMIKGTC